MTRPDAIALHAFARRQGGFMLGPIDLCVPVGTVVGFVGPNGAGKTSTLKALLGMTHMDAGDIRVLGQGPGLQHSRLGVVLDSVPLPPDWTSARAARVLRPFYPVWDDELFERLLSHLVVPAATRVGSLSRGEGLKLQLALALAHHPDLLLLDEPTSGLDPAARIDVLDVLRDFMVDPDHSILFSTHITSDLERIADTLHVLSGGRTAFAGTLDELYESYGIVRAPATALDEHARAAIIGQRVLHDGRIEGLVRLEDTALFPRRALIEQPSLDEAVAALGRSHL